MIDRRDFMNALPVIAGAFFAGAALVPKPEPKQLANIHKLFAGEWVKVRMFELRKGDRFRHQDFDRVYRAESPPWFNDEYNNWAIEALPVDIVEMASNKRA